tara:strand:- start:5577 stop:5795 length:219 start_codon:yes stop_codon:yes gene_type:complete
MKNILAGTGLLHAIAAMFNPVKSKSKAERKACDHKLFPVAERPPQSAAAATAMMDKAEAKRQRKNAKRSWTS